MKQSGVVNESPYANHLKMGLDNFSHCESMLRYMLYKGKIGISGVHTFRKRNSA